MLSSSKGLLVLRALRDILEGLCYCIDGRRLSAAFDLDWLLYNVQLQCVLLVDYCMPIMMIMISYVYELCITLTFWIWTNY